MDNNKNDGNDIDSNPSLPPPLKVSHEEGKALEIGSSDWFGSVGFGFKRFVFRFFSSIQKFSYALLRRVGIALYLIPDEGPHGVAWLRRRR